MKNKILLRLLCTVPLLAAPRWNAFADAVGWHPYFGGDVGLGLDLRNQSVTKPRVAVFDTTTAPPYSGSGQQSIDVVFAQHALDMVKSFSLNANISISYQIYSGSIGFNFIDQQSFSQNTLTFVFDCTRDFGNSSPTFLRLDPDFTNVVNSLRQTSIGADDLHQKITDLYGTHVIYGYQGSAKVVVVYQFQYGSSSIARRTALSIDASFHDVFEAGSFSSFVQQQFQQTDTQVSLNVEFWSSDPFQAPGFPLATNLTTYDQFVSYSSQIQTYCANMDATHAKRTGYLIEPLQSLPGYLTLIGAVSSTNQFPTSYDNFLQVYSSLKSWEALLLSWTLDNRHMSWLNANAQQQALIIRQEVTKERQCLERLFKAYVETGASLQIPDSIINYFETFNHIPIPTINITDWNYVPDIISGSANLSYFTIGFVNCGPKDLVADSPFFAVTELSSSHPFELAVPIYYSPDEFVTAMNEAAAQYGESSTYFQTYDVNPFLASPIWKALTNAATACKIGFFFFVNNFVPGSQFTDNYFVIRDNSGRTVDSITFTKIRIDTCAVLLEAATQADLALATSNPSSNSVAGRSLTYSFSVTNNGPGAAYGVSFTMPFASTNSFEVVSITGSQGQGAYTNGVVFFEVGPLATGASAAIQLQLVPLVAGPFSPAVQGNVALGAGLTDPNPTDDVVTVTPIVLQSPTLSIGKTGNQIDLSWTADTGRIGLEQATSLQSGIIWAPVPATVLTNGSQRKVILGAEGNGKFFRLHGF